MINPGSLCTTARAAASKEPVAGHSDDESDDESDWGEGNEDNEEVMYRFYAPTSSSDGGDLNINTVNAKTITLALFSDPGMTA